jgi:hypothetical protein
MVIVAPRSFAEDGNDLRRRPLGQRPHFYPMVLTVDEIMKKRWSGTEAAPLHEKTDGL